jgi:hypothetical protein
MLVRLDPGSDYPGHTHAGIEELHLLHGHTEGRRQNAVSGDFLRSAAAASIGVSGVKPGAPVFSSPRRKTPFCDLENVEDCAAEFELNSSRR